MSSLKSFFKTLKVEKVYRRKFNLIQGTQFFHLAILKDIATE
ncbi:hypothetical protein LEP1GSC168_3377 [Leptospira santarosai str. HAI134]|uniref:Uncharacterized protein n=2 Tax=Leptospira santarosai TaxID=28183 RepID=M6UMI8_9LEPT|nr:hypothetical protein LEP1GSC063_3042 [Leptospira santarosai serovar Arenal str. MAVJ 401]EMO24394.1 hypothetical protein LEP1GSC168_3377 [Leptospira santarosai str. HAI134]EMO45800.1 hypothetical protein LEP1GSC187_1483 [Leptospira santarosai str. ZUN179]